MNAAIKRSVCYLVVLTLFSIPAFTLTGKPSSQSQQGKVSDWECVAGPNEDWQCKKEGDHHNKYSLENITRLSLQMPVKHSAMNTHSNWQCMASGSNQDWVCQTRPDDEYQQTLESVTSGSDDKKNIHTDTESQTHAFKLLREEIRTLAKALAEIKLQHNKPANQAEQIAVVSTKNTTKSTANTETSGDINPVDAAKNSAQQTQSNTPKKASGKEKSFSIDETILNIENSILKTDSKTTTTTAQPQTALTMHNEKKSAKENSHAIRQQNVSTNPLPLHLSASAKKQKQPERNSNTAMSTGNNHHHQAPRFTAIESEESTQPLRKTSRGRKHNNIALQLMAEQMNSESPTETREAEVIRNNSRQTLRNKVNYHHETTADLSRHENKIQQQHSNISSSYYSQPTDKPIKTHSINHSDRLLSERTDVNDILMQHPRQQHRPKPKVKPEDVAPAPQYQEYHHAAELTRSEYDQHIQYAAKTHDNITDNYEQLNNNALPPERNVYYQSPPVNNLTYTRNRYQQPQAISARDIIRRWNPYKTDETTLLINAEETTYPQQEIIKTTYTEPARDRDYNRQPIKSNPAEGSSADRLHAKTRSTEMQKKNHQPANYSPATETDQLPEVPDFLKMEEKEDLPAPEKSKTLSLHNAPVNYFTLQWASAVDKERLEDLKLRYPLLAQGTIIVSQTNGQEKYMLVNGLFKTMHLALASLQQEPWRQLATRLNPWARTIGSFGAFLAEEKPQDLSGNMLPQGGYTIQWASSPTLEYINALRRTYPQLAAAKILRLTMRQQTQYLLTEGVYPDRLTALDAISIPELQHITQQLQPKARPVASLQNAKVVQQNLMTPTVTAALPQQLNRYTIQWIISGDPDMLLWVQRRYPILKHAVTISENGQYLLIQGSFDSKLKARKILSQPAFQQVVAALNPMVRLVSEMRLANRLNMF
ncbi:MAG: hypothetical protein OXC48_04075 [Endozoicomonadaceae bacterium]|nr:hypothetical protein [Endozoicomonadaceae bacterium]